MMTDLYINPETGDLTLSTGTDGTVYPIECQSQRMVDQQNMMFILLRRPVSVYMPTIGYGLINRSVNNPSTSNTTVEADFKKMAKEDGCIKPSLTIVTLPDGNSVYKTFGSYVV